MKVTLFHAEHTTFTILVTLRNPLKQEFIKMFALVLIVIFVLVFLELTDSSVN